MSYRPVHNPETVKPGTDPILNTRMRTKIQRGFFVLFLVLIFHVAVYLFLGPTYFDPDGLGYLAYLPSIFSQHSLSFVPTFEATHIDLPLGRTATDWAANVWAFGSSFMWLPFYKLGLLFNSVLHRSVVDSFGLVLAFVNFASMLFGALSVSLLAAWLPASLSRMQRWGIALATFLGTPLFFYSFISGTMAHAATSLLSGLFLVYWYRTARDIPGLVPSIGRWWTLGLLGGVAAMARTQESLIFLAPLYEIGCRWRLAPNQRQRVFVGIVVLALGGFVGFSPQALLWKCLYGHWLRSPQTFNLAWSNFSPISCLLSPFHGLLLWTPLYGVGVAGLVVGIRSGEWRARPLLFILMLQWIVCAFCAAWWEGFSFSLRLMTGTFVIVGWGIGRLAVTTRTKDRQSMLAGIMLLCVGWSLWLALHAYTHILNLNLYLSWRPWLIVVNDPKALWHGFWATHNHFGRPSPSLYLSLAALEALVGLWLWQYRLSFYRGAERLKTVANLLTVTFLPWIIFTLVMITNASRAPHPTWNGKQPLDESQLGRFFLAQTFQVKALYHAQQGNNNLALDDIRQAEDNLAIRPDTESQRQSLSTLKQTLLQNRRD